MNAPRQEMAVRRWLSELGVRCSATMKREEAELRARDYAKAMTDLPPEMFCEQSREAAAQRFEYFPAYKAIRDFLTEWWKDHRPQPPTLPGGNDASLDWTDRVWLQSWLTDRAQDFQANGGMQPRQTMIVRLDLIRMRRPALFRHLCRTDVEVASIAVQRHWREVDEVVAGGIDARLRADWGGITPGDLRLKIENLGVLATMGGVGLATAALGMLRIAIQRYAPHHLPELPERIAVPIVAAQGGHGDAEGMRAIDVAREEVARLSTRFAANKPGAAPLPPAHLEAVRAANPTISRVRGERDAAVAATPPDDDWHPPWEQQR